MKIIVLNGFDTDNLFEKYLNSWLESKKVLVANLKIRDLELGPCRSCGSCGTRTPGQCVLKDGIEDVMKTVVTADVMILLSPVHFGGYSATLKKVLDRFMLL